MKMKSPTASSAMTDSPSSQRGWKYGGREVEEASSLAMLSFCRLTPTAARKEKRRERRITAQMGRCIVG